MKCRLWYHAVINYQCLIQCPPGTTESFKIMAQSNPHRSKVTPFYGILSLYQLDKKVILIDLYVKVLLLYNYNFN